PRARARFWPHTAGIAHMLGNWARAEPHGGEDRAQGWPGGPTCETRSGGRLRFARCGRELELPGDVFVRERVARSARWRRLVVLREALEERVDDDRPEED